MTPSPSRREQVQEMLAEIQDADAGVTHAQDALRDAKGAKLAAEDRLVHFLKDASLMPDGAALEGVIALLKAVVGP